jgi:hypothetical protein
VKGNWDVPHYSNGKNEKKIIQVMQLAGHPGNKVSHCIEELCS